MIPSSRRLSRRSICSCTTRSRSPATAGRRVQIQTGEEDVGRVGVCGGSGDLSAGVVEDEVNEEEEVGVGDAGLELKGLDQFVDGGPEDNALVRKITVPQC